MSLYKGTEQVLSNSKKILKNMIYSSEEQLVGYWVDSKPIYQRTINCGDFASAGLEKVVKHNIEYIDNVIYIYTIVNNSTDGWALSIPYIDYASWRDAIQMYVTKTDIRINSEVNRTGCNIHVTLQYTKTTD